MSLPSGWRSVTAEPSLRALTVLTSVYRRAKAPDRACLTAKAHGDALRTALNAKGPTAVRAQSGSRFSASARPHGRTAGWALRLAPLLPVSGPRRLTGQGRGQNSTWSVAFTERASLLHHHQVEKSQIKPLLNRGLSIYICQITALHILNV